MNFQKEKNYHPPHIPRSHGHLHCSQVFADYPLKGCQKVLQIVGFQIITNAIVYKA